MICHVTDGITEQPAIISSVFPNLSSLVSTVALVTLTDSVVFVQSAFMTNLTSHMCICHVSPHIHHALDLFFSQLFTL